MVGAEGFEPPTLCSQSRCATRLRYAPMFAASLIVSQQGALLEGANSIYACIASFASSQKTNRAGIAKIAPSVSTIALIKA